MKKLSKHYTPRPLYIPARPPDFTYRFTHLLFSCSNTHLFVLLYFLAHSPWPDLYFWKTSPECLTDFYHHRARNNIQTRPPVPDEFLKF